MVFLLVASMAVSMAVVKVGDLAAQMACVMAVPLAGR